MLVVARSHHPLAPDCKDAGGLALRCKEKKCSIPVHRDSRLLDVAGVVLAVGLRLAAR